MQFIEEQRIFDEFVRSKGLKQTEQRKEILRIFLKTEKHLTAEELYRLVKKKIPSIGFSTIYRTLKLLCECELCRELKLEDGTVRYEHLYGHEHHDHIICIRCGKFIEVVDPEIERLQERLAEREGFILKGHKLLMYGICKECKEV
ncbi:MAG: transcriptional repressor [Thermodesulfovibrionia bacterium]